MNKIKRPFGLLACISFVIATVGGIIQFLAFYSGYDLTIRHFEYGNVLSIAAGCICALGVLLAVSQALLIGKRLAFSGRFPIGAPAIFVSVYCGFLIIGNTAVSIIFRDSRLSVLSVCSGIFAVISGIYLIISVFEELAAKSAVQALSLALPLWLGFSVMNAYHTTDSAMNDPFQMYYIVLIVTLLLYFTAQAGITFRPDTKGRLYLMSSLLLLSSGGTVILTRLIISAVQRSAFDVSILESLLFLGLYVYAAIKFISLDKCAAAGKTKAGEDDIKTDDDKTDDVKADDVEADDVKTDDVKTDDVKTDDVKADDVKENDTEDCSGIPGGKPDVISDGSDDSGKSTASNG